MLLATLLVTGPVLGTTLLVTGSVLLATMLVTSPVLGTTRLITGSVIATTMLLLEAMFFLEPMLVFTQAVI